MQSTRRCHACGAEFAVGDEVSARRVNCPFCSTVIPVTKEKAGKPDLARVRRQLIESELIGVETLDEQVERWRRQGMVSDDEAGEDLLRWLTDGNFINRFQADALRAGQCGPMMFGPYRVYDRVAIGRLGGIYRAIHEAFQQPVCLKILPSSLQDSPEDFVRIAARNPYRRHAGPSERRPRLSDRSRRRHLLSGLRRPARRDTPRAIGSGRGLGVRDRMWVYAATPPKDWAISTISSLFTATCSRATCGLPPGTG